MDLVNLSAEPLGILHSWIPHDLEAERIVFLPDACPGKSPLPTGTAVLTRQNNWRKFAVSDCGCGMRLLRSDLSPSELDLARWDQVADLLRRNKGGLGDLGGGNHFLDALEPYDDGPLHFLIHTGSRNESGHVEPGDLSILPSHMLGDVVLVRATDRVVDILNSISHGTGRKMSRSDCKPLADGFDFAAMRRQIMIPTGVNDSSLRTDGPFAYRDLDECMSLIDDYVDPVTRYSVIGYMGHF